MNYRKKYIKYKNKYLNLKKISGGDLSLHLKNIIINNYKISDLKLLQILDKNNIKQILGFIPPTICEQQCNDNNSRKFIKINSQYKKLLKKLPYFGKKELIKSLTHGNGVDFYEQLIKKHHFIYDNKTISSIKLISEIFNTKLVLFGTSETLAFLGLSLINSAKKKHNVNSSDKIAEYISSSNQILSSMEDWTEEKNQAIIIDTFEDVSSKDKRKGYKDVWGITDSSIGIILHPDCIIYRNNNYYLDFNKAIQKIISPDPKIKTHYCRVTIFEICLIYKIISKKPNDYIINFIYLKDIHNHSNLVMVFIINKKFIKN